MDPVSCFPAVCSVCVQLKREMNLEEILFLCMCTVEKGDELRTNTFPVYVYSRKGR